MIARPLPWGNGGGMGAGVSAFRSPGKFESHCVDLRFTLQHGDIVIGALTETFWTAPGMNSCGATSSWLGVREFHMKFFVLISRTVHKTTFTPFLRKTTGRAGT